MLHFSILVLTSINVSLLIWHIVAFRPYSTALRHMDQASSRNPQDLQCVTLKECTKDVNPHLKSLKVGVDGAIRDEMTLLLVRAGKVFL